MLTEAELVQMTEVFRDDLDNEELESLGWHLGHPVKVIDSVSDVDGYEGKLGCRCGWESKWMKGCWFREYVQAHLEEVISNLHHSWPDGCSCAECMLEATNA
jgi:hypothetical protein